MGHIWLIGMMGSGKTTAGVLAAQILERPFIDTDDDVMVETGRTIHELFEESEFSFREAESAVIAAVSLRGESVIATGGGSILSSENVNAMQRSGTIVLLEADAVTLTGRVGEATGRPLIQDPEAIERILKQRAQAYQNVARRVVSTVGRTPLEVAKEVAGCVDM
jgi:shikimate kinase